MHMGMEPELTVYRTSTVHEAMRVCLLPYGNKLISGSSLSSTASFRVVRKNIKLSWTLPVSTETTG